MSDGHLREIVIEADLNDAYDGIARLLGDSERSGYELRAVVFTTRSDKVKVARITLGIPASADTLLIAARSSRHPAVRRAFALETVADFRQARRQPDDAPGSVSPCRLTDIGSRVEMIHEAE